MTTTVLWFRRDLRLADNPALLAAINESKNLLPVYLHTPDEEAPWAPGTASQWWLHHSLTRLQAELGRRGSGLLVIKTKSAGKALLKLCSQYQCQRVVWSRLYEPSLAERDRQLAEQLNNAGIQTLSCSGNLFAEPGTLHNQQGEPYRVFSAFWKNLSPMLERIGTPDAAPLRLPPLPSLPAAGAQSDIKRLRLLPTKQRCSELAEAWNPGESGAHKAVDEFMAKLADYAARRDRPDMQGTSRLSPHLHFGELSVRQAVHSTRYNTRVSVATADSGRLGYLRELGWREFARHLLWHFPDTAQQPLDERFADFPWRRSKKDLQCWQQGSTGIPIVDAGMRELGHSGWMHNRVRMIVASFLTKHLRLPWQLGAQWFWDSLVDADLANNTLGWQWTAGCGADAAPYFRVFNPVMQGRKFDPLGVYVRRWLPELAALSDTVIHEPWAKPKALKEAGIQLGRDYPRPVVDLAKGRRMALAAFESIKFL